MKRVLLGLALLLIWGCDRPPETSAGCPAEPAGALTEDNVKRLDLKSSSVKESGRVAAGKYVGYVFEAEAGDQLSYKTAEDLCIWVFSPENKLLSGLDLKQGGAYTLQVSAPRGSTTFNLEMGLGNLDSPAPGSASASGSAPASAPAPASPVSPKSFTEKQAAQLVQRWLDSKSKIFAHPYNEALAIELTTGQRLTKTMGAVAWLRENNGYYVFKLSKLESYWNFVSSGNVATIDVSVTEDLILYVNGQIDYDATSYGPKTKNYRFAFQLQGKTWKIENVSGL